ncbi:MAG TPA: OmpA family protein [Sandaracinaceae bacterium LLY-WYZ-13_1]|nr:OmpA family protein [Sandaracinaceae bacterium LLY-WYZ-13_1]
MNDVRRAAFLAAALGVTGCAPAGELDACRDRAAELEAGIREGAEHREALEERLARLQATNDAMERTILTLAGGMEEAEESRAELESSLQAASSTLAELEEARGELTEDLQRTRRSLTSAERSLAELRAREARARRRAETFRSLLTRMRELIESNEVRVRVHRNRMVVEMPERVLFDSGRAELRSRGEDVVTQVGEVLQSLEDRDFQVAGHTDSEPIRRSRYDSNWELSTARALTVAELLREQGMPAERLSVAGFADTQPVASNETEQGRAQNRRIEIVLLPNLDELPDLSELEDGDGES